jgi:hypothetical protein
MFSTISQANASTTAMTNTTPAGLDMSLESLVYIDPDKLPSPKLNTISLDDPDDDSPFTVSFHLHLSLLSILLPYTSSKTSTKKSTPLAKVKPTLTQLRASSNLRDLTLALLPPQLDNARKKPSSKYLTSSRPRPQ